MTKKITINNTKAEMLEAYNSLLAEIEQAEKANLEKEKERQEKHAKIERAEQLTDEGIIKSIAGLKASVNTELDKISGDLSGEYKKLKDLREAVEVQEKYLEEVYEIKAAAHSLAALMQAQQKKNENFETEMEASRQEWEKQEALRAGQQKEAEEQWKKERKREEEEYTYKIKTERQRDEDAYKAKKEAQERELAEKKVVVEKGLKEREEGVAASEKELAALRKQVETFDAELEKALEAARKAVTEELQQKHKFEMDLFKKETDGQVKLLQQTITSLEKKITEQEKQVEFLGTRAEHAGKQVQDIALKAIEGAAAQKITVSPYRQDVASKET